MLQHEQLAAALAAVEEELAARQQQRLREAEEERDAAARQAAEQRRRPHLGEERHGVDHLACDRRREGAEHARRDEALRRAPLRADKVLEAPLVCL